MEAGDMVSCKVFTLGPIFRADSLPYESTDVIAYQKLVAGIPVVSVYNTQLPAICIRVPLFIVSVVGVASDGSSVPPVL